MGDIQGTFSPNVDPGFGIRNATWHPTGMFIAVGGWDDKVRFIFCPTHILTLSRSTYLKVSPGRRYQLWSCQVKFQVVL